MESNFQFWRSDNDRREEVAMGFVSSRELLHKLWESDIENADEFAELVKRIEYKDYNFVLEPYRAKLKSCPFCGNRPVFNITTLERQKCVNIVCDLCGCQTKLFSDRKDKMLENPDGIAFKSAIRTWNRRAKPRD